MKAPKKSNEREIQTKGKKSYVSLFGRLIKDVNTFSIDDDNQRSRHIFIGSSIIILVLLLLLGVRAGVNGDDYFQNSYSDNITGFYSTLGQDTSCFRHQKAPIQYYGGLFELTTGIINQSLGLDIYDANYHLVRHITNTIFGFCCIVILGLWLRNSGGYLLANLGIWLVFFSPRFVGHTTMNPKDIPFAAGYLIALYFLSRILKTFPKISWKMLLGLAIGIGISIGVRIGGLLLFGITFLFVAIRIIISLLESRDLSTIKQFIAPTGKIITALLVGLGIGLLFWPYGLVDPINHIPESLQGFTEIGDKIRVLFNGKEYFGNRLPWYYHPMWMFYTIPISVLLGLLLLIFFLRSWIRKAGWMDAALSTFAMVFPVLYIIFKNSTLHDGWRHITFVYPPMVFLAACGWFIVLTKFWKRRKTQFILIGIFLLSMLESGAFIARNLNHPYVYFNPICGGMKGAQGWFELDYWGTSAGEAADWMVDNILNKNNGNKTFIIATNFEYPVNIKLSQFPNVTVKYVKYRERHFQQWDYGIFVSRFVPGIQLRKGLWPPSSQLIHSVKSDGVDLAVILHNEDEAIFRGGQLVQQGLYQEAINILLGEAKKHPENEIIWLDLGFAYQNLQNFRSAEECFKNSLTINPHSIYGNNFLAYNYFLEGKEDQSIQLFKYAIEIYEANDIANYYLAQLYEKKGEHQLALSYGLRAIEINSGFDRAYELVSSIYLNLGYQDESQKYQILLQNLRNR